MEIITALRESPLLMATMAAALPVMVVSGVALLTAPQPGETILGLGGVATAKEAQPGPLARLVDALGRRLAPTAMRMVGERQVAATRRKLEAAGRYGGQALVTFMGRRAVLVLTGVVYALVMLLQGRAFFGLFALVAGTLAMDVWLSRTVRIRQEAIERSLPDFLDILSVTISAGLSFRQAMARLAEAITGPLAEEIQYTLRQMEIGMSRRAALESLRDRNQAPTLSAFVTALLQGEELGAPLAATLQELSESLRQTWAQQAKRRAARAEGKISLVLTTLIAPASLLLFGAGILLDLFGGENGIGSILGG